MSLEQIETELAELKRMISKLYDDRFGNDEPIPTERKYSERVKQMYARKNRKGSRS